MNKVPFSTTLNLKMNTDPVRSYLQLNIWVFIINDYLHSTARERKKETEEKAGDMEINSSQKSSHMQGKRGPRPDRNP